MSDAPTKPWSIYVLRDPRTNEIRYVGFTAETLRRRLGRHLSDATLKRKTHCHRWILALRSLELIPSIEAIEQGSGPEWANVEQKWISFYRNNGTRLTNLTDGGEGGHGSRKRYLTHEQLSAMAKERQARFTPEQRSEMVRKGREAMGPEFRRELALRREANRTIEQRKASAAKRMLTTTKEQRREVAIRRFAKTRDSFIASTRKFWDSTTPEQRSEMARNRKVDKDYWRRLAMASVKARAEKRVANAA